MRKKAAAQPSWKDFFSVADAIVDRSWKIFVPDLRGPAMRGRSGTSWKTEIGEIPSHQPAELLYPGEVGQVGDKWLVELAIRRVCLLALLLRGARYFASPRLDERALTR